MRNFDGYFCHFTIFYFSLRQFFSKLLTENHSLSSASSHGNFSSTIMRTWKCPKYVIIDESDSSCSNTRDSWKYPQLSPINSTLNYNRLNGALKIANNQTVKETEIKLFARESFARLLVYFFPRNSAISLNLMLYITFQAPWSPLLFQAHGTNDALPRTFFYSGYIFFDAFAALSLSNLLIFSLTQGVSTVIFA